MPLKVGMRVVRGPDWEWKDQDGGEGHVGTVVTIGKLGVSNPGLQKIVVVLWDKGTMADYRVGFDDKYDLLIYDNAPAGVKHDGVVCDECNEEEVSGLRWKCSSCYDYDLCSSCYMGNKHDTSHAFLRILTRGSVGKLMPPRSGSKQVQPKGLFSGAKVCRGRDWRWQDQDGGSGSTGEVVRQATWANTLRSAVAVRWDKGGAYEYRVGHDGKVDVKCIKAANGSAYYKDHLPRFGETDTLEVGDRVAVMLEKPILEAMQKDHGGWVDGMEKVIGKIGTLYGVLGTGDVMIKYPGGQRWTFNPAAVTVLPTFKAGDKVKIISDLEKAKKLQSNHGGWNSKMDKALGKEGRVLLVDADGDVKVNVEGQFWTFNPDSLTLLEQGSGAEGVFEQDREELFIQLMKHLLDPLGLGVVDSGDIRQVLASDKTADPKEFLKAVIKGDVDKVKEALNKDKNLVKVNADQLTALHLACYHGNLPIVDILCKAGANLNAKDKDGDTPIALAAYQDKPKLIQYLLSKGADPNTTNNEGSRSPLHIAASKNHIDCVKALLKGSNPNIQDKAGDTPLHDAIRKKHKEVTEVLVNDVKTDLKVGNKRSFNPLHHAAVCDNPHATRVLVKKRRSLVDIRKDDGYTALHIAVHNNHRNIAQILATEGKCAIDMYNEQHQTPLVLAIARGYTPIIVDLIDHGADVNSADGDGDTCLHLAVMKHRQGQTIEDSDLLKKFRSKYRDNGITSPLLALMCYLVQEGASVDKTNLKKHTPLNYVKEGAVRKVLEHIARKVQRAEAGDSSFVKVEDGEKGGDSGGGRGDGGTDNKGNRTETEDDTFSGVHVIQEPDKEVTILETIGKGGFGEVHKGRWRGTPVAIKLMDTEGSRRDDVRNEVSVHKRALHPNIVQLMGIGYKVGQALIVMQFIDGHNLMDVIFKDGNPHTFDQKVRMSRDILSAVTYLHHCKILHLDIKPQNIIVERMLHKPYLCDLGLAHIKTRCTMSRASHIPNARGTLAYMPPESLQMDGSAGGMQATSGSDMWSLACTLLEFFSGDNTWPPMMNQFALMLKLNGSDVMPPGVDKLDRRVKGIVKPCFKKNPSDRPSAERIMQEFSGLM